jgi:hypothetical protein
VIPFFGNRFAAEVVTMVMNSHKPQFGRSVRLIIQASVISGGLAFMAGCASEPDSHVVSAPPPPPPTTQQVIVAQPGQPATTVAAPATAVQTQNGTIVVTQAPPAAQQEVVLAQPSSDHKWVPGYWTWRNERYEWMAGHWEIPPSQNSVWVAPRWERRSDGSYQFYEGYWQ